MRRKRSHEIFIDMQNKLYLRAMNLFLQCAFAIFTEGFACQTSRDDNVIIGNSYEFSIS